MKKRLIFTILLFVLSVLLVLAPESFSESFADEVFPLVMVEVKKDVSVNEFYDTNSAIRSRMFYQTFLERFAKANNMAAGGFNVLPVGIYFIPIDAVFFKMTKTGIYAAIVINAEPGMTLSEFYATNSLVNRKLGWDFFKERFAEFQEIPNEEKEFQKLKPGAWIIPFANIFFWTPKGIKSPFEMAFKPVKGDLYSAEFPKEILKKLQKTLDAKISNLILFITLCVIIAIFTIAMISDYLIRHKFFDKRDKEKSATKNKTSYV